MAIIREPVGAGPLPLEILYRVCTHLDPRGVVALGLTCTSWGRVASQDSLWEVFNQRRWWSTHIARPLKFHGPYMPAHRAVYVHLVSAELACAHQLQAMSECLTPAARHIQFRLAVQELSGVAVVQMLHEVTNVYHAQTTERLEAQDAIQAPERARKYLSETLPAAMVQALLTDLHLQYFASQLFLLQHTKILTQRLRVLVAAADGSGSSLMDGCILVAQSHNANIRPRDITEQLAGIVQQVWRRLGCLAEDGTSEGAAERVSQMPNKVVLDAADKVMFEDMGFAGDQTNYYSTRNSYMDEVLKRRRGIPITLSILYLDVCRRAGMRNPPRCVSMPGHFLLRCDSGGGAGGGQECYIDAFNRGRRITRGECQAMMASAGLADPSDPRYLAVVPEPMVWLRCLRNLEYISQGENDLETQYVVMSLIPAINPEEEIRHRMEAAFQLGLYDEALADAQSAPGDVFPAMFAQLARSRLADVGRPPKGRPPPKDGENEDPGVTENGVKRKDGAEQKEGVKYRVGQVFRHVKYNYTGVIIGWDEQCNEDEEWILTMGVDKLPQGRHQPFYNMLVDCRDRPGQTQSYVAQENICVTEERLRSLENERAWGDRHIHHRELGLYFRQKLTNGRYLPTEELLKQYPEDMDDDQQMALPD